MLGIFYYLFLYKLFKIRENIQWFSVFYKYEINCIYDIETSETVNAVMNRDTTNSVADPIIILGGEGHKPEITGSRGHSQMCIDYL